MTAVESQDGFFCTIESIIETYFAEKRMRVRERPINLFYILKQQGNLLHL